MHAAVAADSSPILQPAQAYAFARDGYLPWRKVLTDEELVTLRREYDRILAEAAAENGARDLARDGATDGKGSGRRMLQIMQVCERSLIFRRLIHDDRLLAPIRALLGPNLQLFHDQALCKPARDGGEVSWHQDNGYWACRPATLVSCWLTLDDADADNGAMQFIPGSHLVEVAHVQSAATKALLEVEVDRTKAVTVPLPAGACLYHHCQTLHYTAPNFSERQRRAFVIHVMTPGTTHADGTRMPAGWSRPILGLGM